jgi:hypothetical protein
MVTFGLGKLSWWAFEGRFNGLKRYFKPRWPAMRKVESG